MRGGTCTTKPIVETSGRDAISSTNHDNVLEGTLGPLGGMVGNLTFPHYNALAQTLSTVAENMVEDVMTEVLKEIDDDKIEDLVCEAFKRACYSTVWGSNPFIKDSVNVLEDNDTQNSKTDVKQTNAEKTDDSKEEEDRYNLRKIYMKNLGNKGETDNVMMSYFSPHVFRYAISNMGLGGVVKTKLKGIEDELKKKIIDKIKTTAQKFKNSPKKTENLTFEWVDKEEFIQKKQVNTFAPPTSTGSVFRQFAEAIKPEEKPQLNMVGSVTSFFSPKAYAEKLGTSMAKGAIDEGRRSVSNGLNTLANYGSRNNQTFMSVPLN